VTWWAALISVLVSVAKSFFGLDKPVKETIHEVHPDLDLGDDRLRDALDFRVHHRAESGDTNRDRAQ